MAPWRAVPLLAALLVAGPSRRALAAADAASHSDDSGTNGELCPLAGVWEDEGFSVLQRRSSVRHGQRGSTSSKGAGNPLNLGALDGEEPLRVLRKASKLEYLSYDEVWTYYRTLEQLAPTRVKVFSARELYPFVTAFEGDGTEAQRTELAAHMKQLTCGSGPCDIPIVRIGGGSIGNTDAVQSEPAEVLAVGPVHGNEKMGVQVIAEVARLLALAGAAPGDIAKIRRKVTGGSGSASAVAGLAPMLVERELDYLARQRAAWLVPFANPWGYLHDEREELGVDPNRDAPYLNEHETDSGLTCLQTMTTRTIHALLASHLFHNMINYHGGTKAMVYPWGGDNHLLYESNGGPSKREESLDRSSGAPTEAGERVPVASERQRIIASALHLPRSLVARTGVRAARTDAALRGGPFAEASLHEGGAPDSPYADQPELAAHAPDWAALRQVARRMQLAAGSSGPGPADFDVGNPDYSNPDNMWYPSVGEHTSDIYSVRGDIMDFAYASSWETGVYPSASGSSAVCPGTDPKRTDYSEGGAHNMRVLSFLVELDVSKEPEVSSMVNRSSGADGSALGADSELFSNSGDQGHIARNARSLLSLFEMAVPSVRVDASRGVWYGAGCAVMDSVRVWDLCDVSSRSAGASATVSEDPSGYRLLKSFSNLPCSGLHLWSHSALEDEALGGAPDLGDPATRMLMSLQEVPDGSGVGSATAPQAFPGEQRLADALMGSGDADAARLLLSQPECLAFEAAFDQHWRETPAELGINPEAEAPEGLRPQALSVKARTEENFEIQTLDGSHHLRSTRVKLFFPLGRGDPSQQPAEYQGGWKEAGLEEPPTQPLSSMAS